MTWVSNREDVCNNPSCREPIFWCNLDLTRHHRTGRQRPLNRPYHPDQNPNPDYHTCMQDRPPSKFIQKYEYIGQRYMVNLYRYGYPVVEFADVEVMKDPLIKTKWDADREAWLEKWEAVPQLG